MSGPADQRETPTVLVSVAPRLLSDALERLLSAVPCRIVLPGAASLGPSAHVAVAVVNGEVPDAVDADVVIRVSDGSPPGAPDAVGSLPELVAQVARAVGSSPTA